ncbi:hypothetical protein PsorP6_010408 [Peronosclerospora sorghi]|uniref:Uncharacterized protein n=1 Tax=Peronosclerospora sorghi TaxID=230839 RepID=A0ACC0VYP3_9STRA|nr:hypothetical protein PsorP6_010408 [Peronosclerospora sorghi]
MTATKRTDPVDAKPSTRRPSVQTFVLNRAAPSWTPSTASRTKKFVPSVTAPTFVPAARKCTVDEHTNTTAASPTQAPPPATTEASPVKPRDDAPSSTPSSPVTSMGSSSASEPEVDEDVPQDEADGAVPRQAARKVYTIAHLLELEPDVSCCVTPERVRGLVVAAEKPPSGRRALVSNSERKSTTSPRRRARPTRTDPPPTNCAPLVINDATRWKPSHAIISTPASSHTAAVKEATALLNKLSMEKFTVLSDALIRVATQHEDVLRDVVALILAKAQLEWHFSTMYAALCAKMTRPHASPATLEAPHKLFRHVLLHHCQASFDHAVQEQHAVMLLKRKRLGHMRFVGELYNHHVIRGRIMHECIGRLFRAGTSDALECLCTLLTTMGKALETQARDKSEQERIEAYFASMYRIETEETTLSARIRFMLHDVRDLRANRWQPRRQETPAMTLAQVHAVVEQEDEAGRHHRVGSVSRRAKPGPPDADGWATVGGTGRVRDQVVAARPPVPVPAPVKSETTVAQTLYAIVADVVVEEDVDAAVARVVALDVPSAYVEKVASWVMTRGLEKDDATRVACGHVLVALVAHRVVGAQSVVDAVAAVVAALDDWALDIPLVVAYLSVVLAPCFVHEVVTLDVLMARDVATEKKVELVGHVLRRIAHVYDHGTVTNVVTASTGAWRKVLDDTRDGPEAFCAAYGLEFLLN